MSLKPPKKSDLGKSWMKPRRDKNILIRPEYHLIVTEGTETEPQYFEAIRMDISMFGLYMIRMIFRQIILIKQMNYALIYPQRKHNIMPFGRISA